MTNVVIGEDGPEWVLPLHPPRGLFQRRVVYRFQLWRAQRQALALARATGRHSDWQQFAMIRAWPR